MGGHGPAEWGLVNRVVAPQELMSVSRKLAEDMLSLVPACLSGYKQLIDDGYAESFGEAMKTERRVSGAANIGVRSADVEARREAIRQRGQAQKT